MYAKALSTCRSAWIALIDPYSDTCVLEPMCQTQAADAAAYDGHIQVLNLHHFFLVPFLVAKRRFASGDNSQDSACR
jgi:hypothetical protein